MNEQPVALTTRPADRPLPLVSVIVAAHNLESFIGQCLESLVHQTLTDIEIIAVDDASTDGTARVLAHFAAAHANVRLICHERHRGVSAVRNTAMAAARGKYLAFVDGDDWLDLNLLAALAHRAETTHAEVVVCDYLPFDNQAARFVPLFDHAAGNRPADEVYEPSKVPGLFFQTHCGPWRKFCLRSFVEKHGIRFVEGHIYEDVRFHYALLLLARRVAVLKAPVYFYRVKRLGSITEMVDERVLPTFPSFVANERLLASLQVSDEVWWGLLETELEIAFWVLFRLKSPVRQKFIQAAAAHFAKLPQPAWQAFCGRACVSHIAGLLGLRAGRDPNSFAGRFPLDHRARARFAKPGPGIVTKILRKGPGRLLRAVKPLWKRILLACPLVPKIHARMQRIDEIHRRGEERRRPDLIGKARARLYTILGQTVVLFDRSADEATRQTVQRMVEDRYLSQFVIFRRGDVVVDVGAHVGAFAVPLAKKYPQITVYAVEPDPDNFRLLLRNIEANQAGNVVPVRCALGVPRRATLFKDCIDGANATLDPAQARRYESFTTKTVEVISPEAFREMNGIARCRMLKISAPGSTREILEALPRNDWIDFLAGCSEGDDCPPAVIETICNSVATAYCWRLKDAPEGSAEQACLFHGSHVSHRLLQPGAPQPRAA